MTKLLQILVVCAVLALCVSQIGCGKKAEAQTLKPGPTTTVLQQASVTEHVQALEKEVSTLQDRLAEHGAATKKFQIEAEAREKELVAYAADVTWWRQLGQVVSVIGMLLLVALYLGRRRVFVQLKRLLDRAAADYFDFEVTRHARSKQPVSAQSPTELSRSRTTPMPGGTGNGTDDPNICRMAVRDAGGMRLADPVGDHSAGEQVTTELMEECEDRGIRVLNVLAEPELVGA